MAMPFGSHVQRSPSSVERAQSSLAAISVAAILALSGLAGHAHAQTSIEMRTLAKQSGVEGLPDITIDLSVPATQRYAVVIGNADYMHVTDLKNADADAKIVASYLRDNGYTVLELYDLTKRDFEASLRRMLFDVAEGSEVVFYFAGHGIQIGQQNYLIPIDAQLQSAYDVPFEAVSLTSLMSIVGSRTRSLIAILDSCRDNPFAGKEGITTLGEIAQKTSEGFSPQNTPINSLLVFSTAPGAVAYDGEGENSPFTSALIEVAQAMPDQPVDQVMKEVRRRVYETTDGLQIPWESSSLVETVFISDREAPPVVAEPAVASMALLQEIPENLALSIPLGTRVDIGDELRTALGLDGDQAFRIAQEPRLGRLEIAANGTSRGLSMVSAVSKLASQISYHSQIPQQSATKLDGQSIKDAFVIEVADTQSTVELDMQINPCDFHAGDYLDPEGVGVARYPNEIEPIAALQACLEATQAEPENGRFHYQLGRVYVALRDLANAEAAFMRARDLGHTRAWHGLGAVEIAQLQETGGSLDSIAPEAALAYYAVGVEKGDPYALHALGRQFLLFGRSETEKNQGFELLSRSLELGHTFSMNALGIYFLDEGSPNYSPERALRYLRESAERDDIYGYQNMGFVTLNGLAGLPKDPEAAYAWFVKASDEGHPTAPSSVGRMYANGQAAGGVNYAEAIRWYDIGLERGDPWGGANASWIIQNRQPAGYGIGEAAIRAAKAATLRNRQAAGEAEAVLASLSTQEIDAGAQRLMRELGAEITADGAFGPGSQAALDALEQEYGQPIQGTGVDRLRSLARLFWQNSRLRSDLY